jgi:hypothetical protein
LLLTLIYTFDVDLSPVPLGFGEGKGHPKKGGRKKCKHTEIVELVS